MKRFTWDEKFYPEVTDRNCIGFIAQEVKEIYPKAVNINKFIKSTKIINSEGNEEYKNEVIIEDFHNLNSDQIYKCTYGALKETINKIDTILKYNDNNGNIENIGGTGELNVNKITSNTVKINKGNIPSSSNDSEGELGEIRWSNESIYIKTENGWRKSNLVEF